MNNHAPYGKVVLAGAGPGDPDLITVKAVNYLRQADVVLTDRLVSEDILNTYVSQHAEVLYVGKQSKQDLSISQKSINELMVDYAKQGKLVVRLKGGDVSLFSNIMDELTALTVHGIVYEIVPGVTAALGAAAYAGIPLTARGYATAVRFLTYYKTDVVSEDYWKDLAATKDTLVFYMSSETLDSVVQKLLCHNPGDEKMLAVVEQATTPLQQVYTCRLAEYAEKLKSRVFISPSLVIIGAVVNLHRQFAWIENDKSSEYYFTPVNKVAEQIKLSA